MDSFVLAETFKYLYLLFEDESKLTIDISQYIFTTEAHLLPLSLANYNADNGKVNFVTANRKRITHSLPIRHSSNYLFAVGAIPPG